MADNSFGDFFLTDSDEDDEITSGAGAPEVSLPAVPASRAQAPLQQPSTVPAVTAPAPEPVPVVAQAAPAPVEPQPIAAQAPAPVAASAMQSTVPAPAITSHPPVEAAPVSAREARLVAALDQLMHETDDIQAAALVSLDGFAMASALPDGMQEDRVGAMSAAILGLGERAAAELGRGKLSQVFIQGEGGYVLLTAAGDKAVLTCLADADAKLGLVLYDMSAAAAAIGEILG